MRSISSNGRFFWLLKYLVLFRWLVDFAKNLFCSSSYPSLIAGNDSNYRFWRGRPPPRKTTYSISSISMLLPPFIMHRPYDPLYHNYSMFIPNRSMPPEEFESGIDELALYYESQGYTIIWKIFQEKWVRLNMRELRDSESVIPIQ